MLAVSAACIGVVLALYLQMAVPAGHAVVTPPVPVGGSVDLSQWNFQRDGSVSLSGQWKFFDKTWASELAAPGAEGHNAAVPGPWPVTEKSSTVPRMDGYGTYVLKLKLPTARDGEAFAIDTGYVLSAYRVYANGQLIAESGIPSATAAGEYARAYAQVATVPSDGREVELRFEVSNHVNRYGGSFIGPTMGLKAPLTAHLDFIRALSMFLVGAMAFAALYHFVAYSLNRDAVVSLWFGLFAALFGVRTLLIEPLATFSVPFIGQDWVWRLDFAASILLLPTAFQFFSLSFPRQVAPKYLPWATGFCIGAAGLTLVGGAVIGEYAMKVFECVMLIAIIYLTQGIVRAVASKEQGALLALTGWTLSAGAICHDILLDNGLISGINLIPFGFLGFFLCLSGMLVSRFRDAFRSAQSVSREMRSLNDQLEAAVQLRTSELRDKVEELKRNHDELERAKTDTVTANIAKSRFLANMSHELRTPLNSILGFSEIIRDERLGSLGDQRYGEYASHINESGTHLLQLIGDILDLSRIEAGKVELRFEPVSIAEIAETAMRHAATRERRAEGGVELDIERDLPLVRADRRSLVQMIVNLLSNALKFTPAGGSIVLSAFKRGDGGVTVQVSDSGIGMDPADIPKALAAFSQVDDSYSRRHEGTGLGLPIVKSLIELHGGQLRLESARGQGTCVRLDLPQSCIVLNTDRLQTLGCEGYAQAV